MARYNISIEQTSDPKKLSKIIDKSGKKILCNKISDRVSNPDASKIARVSQKMLKIGTLKPTLKRNTNDLSHNILSAMGCTIISEGARSEQDYSLLFDQIDTETVDNPNKFDAKQFTKIKKTNIRIDHVFKNQNDSIFKLDSDIPDNYKQLNIQNKKITMEVPVAEINNIVLKAVDLSLNTPGIKAVRAFKEI